MISELHYTDLLVVSLLDEPYFRSKQNHILQPDSLILHGKLPMQLERNSFTESFEGNVETGADSLKGLFSFQLVLNLVLSGILGKMALWVNTLQIMTMMPLFMIGFPAISLIFLAAIVNVAEFDFLDPRWTTDLFMVYDEKNKK